MDSSFVPEILVIIEVSEPRLINSYLRKAHQLLFCVQLISYTSFLTEL